MGILGGGAKSNRSTGGILGRQKREEEERKQREAAAIRSALPTAFEQKKTAETRFTVPQLPMQGPPAPTVQSNFEQRIAAGRKSTEGKPIQSFVNRLLEPITALGAITEKPAAIAQQLYTPGAGIAAIGAGTQAAGNILSRIAPSIGRGSGLLPTIGREAIKEGAVGVPLAAGQALAQEPGISGRKFAQQTALGAGLGAGFGAVGGGVGSLINRMLRNNVPDEVMQEFLALPAPRQRGNINTATTPDIMPGFGGGRLLELPGPGPLGLPAPRFAQPNVQQAALPLPRNMDRIQRAQGTVLPQGEGTIFSPASSAPTSARIAQKTNLYRVQFENLMRTAQKFQDEGLFTPGKEDVELESLWSQMAGRDAPNLDDLIKLAYPSKQSKVTPDLVQRARETQFSREVAGAPLPIKTQTERFPELQRTEGPFPSQIKDVKYTPEQLAASNQLQQEFIRNITRKQRLNTPIIGRVDPPVERVGRSLQSEVLPPQAKSVRPRVDMTQPAGDTRMPIQPTDGVRRTTAQVGVPRVTGERAFFSNLEQGGLTPEVQARMSESEKRGYEQITNLETVNSANARIERLGIDRAEAQLQGKTKFKADDVATGMRLIQQLQDAGEVERAVSIAEKVSKQLTEAGQTVQAASIWNRLSPEGALLAAQRKVSRINENLLRGQEEIKLSSTQAQGITDAAGAIQASGGSQERAGTVMEIMDRIRKGEGVTTAEKQLVADFVADAKRFLKPSDTRPPRPSAAPKEMNDVRVRDRVTSFLEDQEQAALDRIRARRNQANALPLDLWADYAIVGATKLAKGTIKFADWSEQMVRDLGEEVRPYLRQVYEKSQEVRNQSVKQINDQVISKAERVAESFIKQKGDQLALNDVEFIRNMAQRVSSLSDAERRVASQDLQAIMQGFEKVGIGRKIAATQYIAMLLNPLTQIRNVVGNEMMYRLERMAKWIGTPIDVAASKVTGGPRTITFKSGPKIWDDFFKPAKDYWGSLGEGMSAGWRGVSPEGLTTKYEIQGQAFRSKYNPLTYMEKSLGAVLQGFDYAAYTRATNQQLSEMAYLDALNKGIQGDDAIRSHTQTYMTNLDDATHNIAKEYGKFATLQDDSLLAQKIMGFRRGANKLTTGSPEFGAGSLVVPFAKTPANLLLRGLDYSPAGILKAMKQTHDILRKPNTDLTRADVINSVTRALMGTGMGATAYWLADKGAMFGRSNKDPEVRKLMQGTGIKDFQINGSAVARMLEAVSTGGDVDQAAKLHPGDTLWAYQWAQPSSMPMAIGSNIYQSRKDEQGAVQTASEAALAGATTLLDSSVLSGIREIFQIPPGEDNVFKAVGMNLLKQLPSQFVPSMARQFNLLFDPTLKETMAMKGDTLGSITNYAESTVPGLAQQFPQRVSTLGEPQTRPNTFFDVFVLPAARNKYNPTPEAQLVIDLLNETGDKNLAPRDVSKYLSSKDVATGEQRRVDLTPEQYVELQTIVGQETANRLKKINPDLPTDRKIEMVIEAFDAAGKIGRNKLKQDVGLRKTR